MPQCLTIQIGGVCIAGMMTGNLGGTKYRISWYSNIGNQEPFVDNVDTGVECQPPRNDPEWGKDLRNDFIHARRAIAAASLTTKQFLDNLIDEKHTYEDDFGVVQIFLRTNCFDRGRITISPHHEDLKATLMMEIGTGPIRPPDAIPIKTREFIKDISLIGIESSISMVGYAFESEGSWMLQHLEAAASSV
jgi:hypothetical protein